MKRKHMQKFAEHGGQARVLAITAVRVYRFILLALLAIGHIVLLAPAASFAAAFGAAPATFGFSPASVNTSNLPQSTVTFYDKKFVQNLKANAPWLRCCSRRELPENSGTQHMLFMYKTLGANTVQAAEGVAGTQGFSVSVSSNTSTIGQYADYVNLSDLSMATAIDDSLVNINKETAYRLSLTLNTLVRNTADGAVNIDSTVSGQSLAYNVAFTRTVITSATQSLVGRNTKAFSNGRYTGIIHPFLVGDALNDAANNSITDILKRTAEGQEKLSELPAPDGDTVSVLEWGGVSFHQSTLVTTTADYQSQSGKTALRTYIIGEDAIIAISLGTKQGAMVGEGDWRNLKTWMQKADPTPTVSDPSRMIGGWCSYNCKFTVTLPPDTTMRLRYIDAVSSIS